MGEPTEAGVARRHRIAARPAAAPGTGPVSHAWLRSLRGLPATLDRPRIDRQLEEALTCGADPLHLAVVFGLDDTTAVGYAAGLLSDGPLQLVAAAAGSGLDDLGFQVRHRRSRTAGFAGDPGQAHRPGTSALPGCRSRTGNLGAGAVWLRLWPCCHRVVTAG
jgi:hypothetical protein